MANSDIYRQLVWKTDLGPAEKLVALAIAEHADAHGKAWPGNKRIAEMTGLSLRTIGRAILKLGDILEQVNTNSRGRPGSTARFQFRAGNPSESRIKNPSESRITTPEMRHSRQKNATFATKKCDIRDAYKDNHIEPQIEPKEKPVAADAASSIFTTGKKLLIGAGVSAAAAGSFLGKLRKDFGDSLVSEGLAICLREDLPGGPSEPKAYLTRVLQNLQKEKPAFPKAGQNQNYGTNQRNSNTTYKSTATDILAEQWELIQRYPSEAELGEDAGGSCASQPLVSVAGMAPDGGG